MKLNAVSRRVALTIFTLSSAAAVGFVMQSGTPIQASVAAGPKVTKIVDSVEARAASAVGQLATPSDADMRAEAVLPASPIVLAVAQDLPTLEMPTETPSPRLGCATALSSEIAAVAMANLTVTAPCLPEARIVISHSGLRFTEVLNAEGTLEISVPVLAEAAEFSVTFPDGSSEQSTLSVPSLRFYDRVALQWTGESGLQIHAREFGADYGASGHVWFNSENDLMDVISGKQGFMLRLGDGRNEISQMAEIYTFPRANATRSGEVILSVEAEVNGSNCGRSIRAQSFQVIAAQPSVTRSLEMSIPECSATGDFLVLKNLLQDLTIAQK
ncbi:hypothetical protein NBRC116601_30550 [Cognatishimia sp. WU-CL00825]|uniref:translocase n=1 Tax=Cognatishimia sp. WU-CL00825 TaxID=3127658 RepID=UPI00310826A7